MSEIFTEKPGVTLGEVFQRAHGGDSWANLGPAGQACAELGAQAVANVAIQRRIDELDAQAAPVSPDLSCTRCEGEAAKVIIVERDGHPARLFAAATWEVLSGDPEAGDLVLTADSGECVAQLGARMWNSVCDAEAILPADLYSRQGKKLAIALDALRDIRGTYEDDERGPSGQGEAARALDKIAELDL